MKRVQLNIPSPCNENYNSFKKTRTGGFCQSCQKEVIDFTTWTDKELIDYFKNHNNQKGCGRFKKRQLKSYQQPENRILNTKYLAGLLGLLALFPVEKTYSQEVAKDQEVINQVNSNKNGNKSEKKKLITVIGRVISEDEGPLPGINVIQKGTENGAITDIEGRFLLQIVPSPYPEDTLVFSFIGFATQEVLIQSDRYDSLEVYMEPDVTGMLGEVVVFGGVTATRWYTPRGLWGRTKNLWWRFKGLFTKNY